MEILQVSRRMGIQLSILVMDYKAAFQKVARVPGPQRSQASKFPRRSSLVYTNLRCPDVSPVANARRYTAPIYLKISVHEENTDVSWPYLLRAERIYLLRR